MVAWDSYPPEYRQKEMNSLLTWIQQGECAAVVGLSGSGKSNLLGFMAHRAAQSQLASRFCLVDCNRVGEPSKPAFYQTIAHSLDRALDLPAGSERQAFAMLENLIEDQLMKEQRICLALDRFDALYSWPDFATLANNLRALRDRFKYQLVYLIAVRQPLDQRNELAELFFGHTLWLGPLSPSDGLWSVQRDLKRYQKLPSDDIEAGAAEKIVALGGGYPSLLRAICEAYADGAALDLESLRNSAAVVRRVEEFWLDHPDSDTLKKTGLSDLRLLNQSQSPNDRLEQFDTAQLTAKEALLLAFFRDHPEQVCEKDDLIRAVWAEDVIFQAGVRDESLAQLARRLRVKIEPDPANPIYIQTIPGRGYLFHKMLAE